MNPFLFSFIKRISPAVLAIGILCFIQTDVWAQTCTVNAGVRYAMCETDGTSWTLNGNSNDPGGSSVPVTWTIISQPVGNNATIVSPNNEVTLVTGITIIGEYVFQIQGVCPDGSGSPVDQVVYRLDEQIPDPGLQPSYEFCTSGQVCVPSPLPDVAYGWVAIEFDDKSIRETAVQFNNSGTGCMDISVPRFYPGGTGKLILFSTRGSCVRRDTVDLFMSNDEPADAGADVYICGDTWVKEPWFDEILGADEYRFMPFGGTQSWTQISSDNGITANISYNPQYNTYADGFVYWTGLDPGTYEFELTFTYPAPCNTTYKDTVVFYANAGVADDCQNFSSGRRVFRDCEGTLDEWVIDLRDYGIDPDLILPGDTIRWSLQSSPYDDCGPNFVLPDPNQLVATIPTEGICSNCHLYATYECASSPGCGDAIEFVFINFDQGFYIVDSYECSPDGNPILINSPTSLSLGSCLGGFYSNTYTIISSPTLATGTTFSSTSGFTNIPLDIGIHVMEKCTQYTNHYLSLGLVFGEDEDCEVCDFFSVTIAGTARDANAGTDAILPCGDTQATLSGSDPNVPDSTGSTSLWSFVSGPNTPVMTDPTLYDLTASGLIPGLYTFKYSVGNAACGFYEDEVTIVVANTPPAQPFAGFDDNPCYGGRYFLSATQPVDGVGSWSVSPSAGITFSDVNDPNAYVEGMQASTIYTFTWTVTNGCGTASDNVLITTTSTQGDYADAGPDICISALSGNLNANTPVSASSTGMWTFISSDLNHSITISDPTDPNSSFSVPSSPDSYFLEWSVTVPGCGTYRDTVIVTRYGSSGSGNVVNLCNGADTYDISYSATFFDYFIWDTDYDGAAGVQFLSSLDANPVSVSFPSSGEYVFYVKKGLADCAPRLPIQVFISTASPPASAGPDVVLCNQFTYQMQGSPAPNGGFWLNGGSVAEGDGILYTMDDVTDPTTNITLNKAGKFNFIWASLPDSLYNTDCITYDTMQIVIIPDADAGANQTFCRTDEIVVLDGNMTTSLGTPSWSFISGPVTPNLVNTDSRVVIYDGFSQQGTYVFEYSITSSDCGVTTDQVSVTINGPEPNAGADFSACNDTLSLNGSAPGAGETALWKLMSGSGSFIGDPANQNVDFGPLIQGDTLVFVYEVTDAGGCVGSDSIVIVADYFKSLVGFPTAINSCGAADGKITVFNLIPNTNYTLNYEKDGVAQGPLSVTTAADGSYEITGLGAGLYENIIFTNTGGCSSEPLDDILLTSPCVQNLGDYVWIDTDEDGIQDGGESGIDGVIVNLYNDANLDGIPDGGIIASDTTAGGGLYLFTDLPEGGYIVEFDLSEITGSYNFTTQTTGTADGSDPDVGTGQTGTIVLSAGVDDLDVDAGIYSSCMPPTITAVNSSDPLCNGDANGTITVTATDNEGIGLEYSINSTDGVDGTWTNTTGIFTGLSAGNYTVWVRNSDDSCPVEYGSNPVVLTNPVVLSVVLDGTIDVTCNGDTDGGVNISVSGGTGAYTFDWDNDGAEDPDNDPEDLSGVGAGTYTVTITDANGCTATTSGIVNENPVINISEVSSTDPTDCSVNDGTVTVTASGGSGSLEYSINSTNGVDGIWQGSNVFGSLAAGSYTVWVRNTDDSCPLAYASNPVVLNAFPGCSCTLNITNVSTGTCDPATNTHTLDVEVTWSDAPTGELIEVTTGGTTLTIDPTTETSPATVQFTVPADGSTGNAISAAFDGETCSDPDGDTYDAQQACPCTLSITDSTAGVCNDNGTNSDPSDDTFDVTVNATAVNGGASGQFNVTDGTTTWGPFDYGTGGTVTGLPADGSTITLTFVDADDSACNATADVSQNSCSNTCVLTPTATTGPCDDGGTNSDPSDDTFDVTVNATAVNGGASGQFNVTDGTTTWGPFDYGTGGTVTGLPADGSTITLTFTDLDDASCSNTADVSQTSCSNTCVLTITDSTAGVCNDNGTNSDPSDDTFDVTVNATAVNGGASGQFNVTDGTTTWGPFDYGTGGTVTGLPADGSTITLTFTDLDDASCSNTADVSQTSCSNTCVLTITDSTAGVCNDNGTNSDPSDDTFDVTVNATAVNGGASGQFNVTDGTTTWGPFDYGTGGTVTGLPADGSTITLTFVDADDSACNATADVSQNSCSNTCVLTPTATTGPCDDGGTNSDPSDDTFDVTVNATATNGGASNQFNVTDGTTTWGPFDYGTGGTVTSLPADGSTITLTFVDADDSACNATADVSQNSCSNTCVLTPTATTGPCDDGGTNSDPSDDTFDVTVNASAVNGGASGQFNVTDGTTTWGPFDYGTGGTVTGLPADGSTITLTFTDVDDNTCSATADVFQFPCSSACVITITDSTAGPCDDGGTNSNPSDDTFDVTVNATAVNGGASGQFNVTDGTTTWGPFDYGTGGTVTSLPADGSTITLTFVDADDSACNATADVSQNSCSSTCVLTPTATTGPCDDGGTNSDPSDDTFDVTVNATATNGGASNQFNVTDGTTTWGPFDYGTGGTVTGLPADGSTITLTFVDADDSACNATADVSQNSCSNTCVLTPTATAGPCDDGGTNSDPSDDTFDVTVNATAVNGGASGQFNVTDGTTTWGPFDYGTGGTVTSLPADGSTITLTFTDVDDNSCVATVDVSQTSCSSTCVITITDSTAGACNDNGTTSDPSDDTFHVTVNATATNGGASNQFNVTDGTTTWGPFDYGTGGTVTGLPADGSTITLTFTDVDDNSCVATVDVSQTSCSVPSCPPIKCLPVIIIKAD